MRKVLVVLLSFALLACTVTATSLRTKKPGYFDNTTMYTYVREFHRGKPSYYNEIIYFSPTGNAIVLTEEDGLKRLAKDRWRIKNFGRRGVIDKRLCIGKDCYSENKLLSAKGQPYIYDNENRKSSSRRMFIDVGMKKGDSEGLYPRWVKLEEQRRRQKHASDEQLIKMIVFGVFVYKFFKDPEKAIKEEFLLEIGKAAFGM